MGIAVFVFALKAESINFETLDTSLHKKDLKFQCRGESLLNAKCHLQLGNFFPDFQKFQTSLSFSQNQHRGKGLYFCKMSTFK
jgi:hypothetical protein